MSETRTGEILVKQLIKWGIDHIYGMPGDSINHFVEDLRKHEDELKFLQIRHEEVGAFAASSYAKLTGKIGACLSITGPGAIHLLNGLYDAKQDGAPVLAIVGQVASPQVGTNTFQEVNLERMFDDVAVFNRRAEAAEQLPDLLNMAIRNAYAQNGVAVLIVPDDLFAVKQKNKQQLTSIGYEKPAIIPDQISLSKAAELLREAKKPVILAGKGARDAREELVAFAEKIQAPVAISLLGKGTLPDYHELNLGQHGQIGTKPAYEAIMETDLLILIGTSFPYRSFLPNNVEAIQIEIDERKLGNYYPITQGLCGDAKAILPSLTAMIEKEKDSAFLNEYQQKMKNWHTQMQKDKKAQQNPVQAPQVMHALENVVEKDAIISCDVGNVTVWTTRYFPFVNQSFVISGRLASMGSALPGAIAAQVAYPDKQVVGICGDGGFTMVMHDFITAVKYNLPVKIIILNNSQIGMIKYEQQEMGHLNYETQLGEADFAAFAEACGGQGFRVQERDELNTVIEQAFLTNKPAIVDVAIEDLAPLPGKISYDQAVRYSQYLVKEFFTNKKMDVPDLEKALRRL